jgi:hypothetical protein
VKEAGFDTFPRDTAGFLKLCKVHRPCGERCHRLMSAVPTNRLAEHGRAAMASLVAVTSAFLLFKRSAMGFGYR